MRTGITASIPTAALVFTSAVFVMAHTPVVAATVTPGQPGSFVNTPPDVTYYAMQGDTPTSIAKRYTTSPNNWVVLTKRNKILNDRTIPIGTPILIPVDILQEEASEARVYAMAGQASYRNPQGQESELSLNAKVQEGGIISTGKNGFLTLVLSDDSRVSLPSNTQVKLSKLRVTKYTQSPRTEIGLLEGKIESRVTSLQSNKGRYEVMTPLAVAGVRGTQFRVGLNSFGISNEVLTGGVAVNSRQTDKTKSDELLLSAGKGNIVGKDGMQAAVDLLPAPQMEARYLLQERPLLQFRVAENPAAKQYRVQIARDALAQDVIAENRFSDNRFRFEGFKDGNYFIRVTAIDQQGLEGMPYLQGFTMKAYPEPPFVVEPKGKSRSSEVRFVWTEAQHAKTYHWQLARDTEFKQLVAEKSGIAGVEYSQNNLADGQYYWRVATQIEQQGKTEQGPYSDIQAFQKLPAQSLTGMADGNDNQMSFNWNGEPGQTFFLQIARDAEFKQILIQRDLTKPELKIPRPDAGVYFIRVRATDPDGYVSPYSATQKFSILPRWQTSDGSSLNTSSGTVSTGF